MQSGAERAHSRTSRIFHAAWDVFRGRLILAPRRKVRISSPRFLRDFTRAGLGMRARGKIRASSPRLPRRELARHGRLDRVITRREPRSAAFGTAVWDDSSHGAEHDEYDRRR